MKWWTAGSCDEYEVVAWRVVIAASFRRWLGLLTIRSGKGWPYGMPSCDIDWLIGLFGRSFRRGIWTWSVYGLCNGSCVFLYVYRVKLRGDFWIPGVGSETLGPSQFWLLNQPCFISHASQTCELPHDRYPRPQASHQSRKPATVLVQTTLEVIINALLRVFVNRFWLLQGVVVARVWMSWEWVVVDGGYVG